MNGRSDRKYVLSTYCGVTWRKLPQESVQLNLYSVIRSVLMTPINSGIDSNDISLSGRMDEWISRQHTILVAAQEHQLQSDQHKVVENDPDITDYPVNSYFFYTPPMSRSNELLPKHKGPYQVIGRQESIYTIEDLARGKQIKTHVHNLRAFIFNPTQVNPLDIAQQNEHGVYHFDF